MNDKKRKRTVSDYFQVADTKRNKKFNSRSSEDATKSIPAQRTYDRPAGLTLINDYITTEEEIGLLAYLDKQPWRTDLSRRTIHYGGTYCIMPPRNASPETRKQIEQTIVAAPPIPAEIDVFIDKMIASGLYCETRRPLYCIVNEYTPGLGISAHVENFRFGEPVCSLTLAGSDTMRFHEMKDAFDGSVRSGKAAKAPKTGEKMDVVLPRRSLVVLKGDARYKWQHEITRGRKSSKPSSWRRVSLTFRVDK